MLVLARKVKERILIPAINATIAVVSVAGNKVRLGIDAPPDVVILREELEDGDEVPPSLVEQLDSQRREKHDLRNLVQGACVGLGLIEKQIELGHDTEAIRKTVQQIRWAFVKHEGSVKTTQPPTAESRPSATTALLVEDQANERALLSQFLQLSGYDVIEANTGEEALDYLQQSRTKPDVVLLDMGLPKMKGDEVVRYVRSNPETGNLKIFVISGRDNTFDLPVDEWFLKPLDPVRLLENLSTLRKVV